jgi:mannose-6-phosphate isomerase-like protein (cupin superfamily)
MISASDKSSFPSWSETQNYGVSYLKVGDEVEPHFHDCNEYWIIISGRGDAMSEGKPYALGPGDMLLTRAGDYHSLKVTEEMVAVYYYGVMPEHGRWGHLHEGVDLPWADHLATLDQRAPA